jgi:hypothetical protein
MSVQAQIPRRPGQPVGIERFPGDVDQVVVLRNGTSVHLRPIRPDDAPRLMARPRVEAVMDKQVRFETSGALGILTLG